MDSTWSQSLEEDNLLLPEPPGPALVHSSFDALFGLLPLILRGGEGEFSLESSKDQLRPLGLGLTVIKDIGRAFSFIQPGQETREEGEEK